MGATLSTRYVTLQSHGACTTLGSHASPRSLLFQHSRTRLWLGPSRPSRHSSKLLLLPAESTPAPRLPPAGLPATSALHPSSCTVTRETRHGAAGPRTSPRGHRGTTVLEKPSSPSRVGRHFQRSWSPDAWRFSPHQAILRHQPGVLQPKSTLTLST